MTRFLLALALIGCAAPHYPPVSFTDNPVRVSNGHLVTPRPSPTVKPVPFYVVLQRAKAICASVGLLLDEYNDARGDRGPYVGCEDANDEHQTYIDLPPEVFRP